MNAPENITEAINQAHDTLAHYDEAMSADQIAYELAGRLRPTKAHTKEAVKQLKQLADLGMIEMEPRAGGMPFYRLISAPASNINEMREVGDIDVVESSREDSDRAVIPPPPEYDPASVSFSGVPTKTYPPSVLHAMVADMAGDSEGGETDAPAVDAQREEFTLLGLIADIRAAVGDPHGRLMQDELVQHIAGVVKERGLLKAENLALKTLEGSMPGFGAEFEASRKHREEMSRVIAELQALRTSHTNAINEADRLRAELATERQAREALQEQSDAIDVKDAAVGYLVRVPKRAPILRLKPESARSAALSAVRSGAARAEVLAVVPVGTARRGAEWQSTEAGG